MDSKTPLTNVYHHHRAPRTPESYFNVPESIALLNIVKSERIQNAFQSNRKNHASVWEMVSEVLNRYSARKRSAKQCCNRYENLKKIYTQLKKNPERHVRRNWPYMFLFKEIEEQRGECWGSNNKRLALINKTHNELSYYHRRRQAATEFSVLMDKQAQAAVTAQQNLLQSLAAQSNDSTTSNATTKLERFLPNHFVEAQLGPDSGSTIGVNTNNSVGGVGTQRPSSESTTRNTPSLILSAHESTANSSNAASALAVSLSMNSLNPVLYADNTVAMPLALQTTRKNLVDLTNALTSHNTHHQLCLPHQPQSHQQQPPYERQHEQQKQQLQHPHTEEPQQQHQHQHQQSNILQTAHNAHANGFVENNVKGPLSNTEGYAKDCNGALNLQTTDNNVSLKSEPMSDGEFNPDDIQLMQSNYNGNHNFYANQIDTNILHPDVIVDTDNLTDCSSLDDCGDGVNGVGGFGDIDGVGAVGSPKSKRKLSTSTDGGDSTNYELIEYLKRREKRDEQMLRRMEAREDRLLNLLERAVQAIEAIIHKNCFTNTNLNNISNNNHNNNNSNNNNGSGNNIKRIDSANNYKEKLLNGESSTSGSSAGNNDSSNVAKGAEENWKNNKCLEKFDVKS